MTETTASEKRHQHVVEYLLYEWQMEDLVRAVEFDLGALRLHLSSAYEGDRLEAELTWFADLMRDLKREDKLGSGHRMVLDELMVELTYLHRTLLDVLQDAEYKVAVDAAQPHLSAMEARGEAGRSEVESMLIALYGWLVLRMSGKAVTPETQESLDLIRDWANLLAGRYIRMRAGEL